MNKNIAIIGAGPGASTLAILLARKGHKVAMFATSDQPPILVGESLVPMIVPMLKDLGVEQCVAEYSLLKPGACFTYQIDEVFEFHFKDIPRPSPSYSYNVPRDQFNDTLLQAAINAGVKLVEQAVSLSVVKGGDKDKLCLDNTAASQAAEFWQADQPDFIVDSAGRTGMIGRLLDIPFQRGERNDIALFAHIDRSELVHPDYVHNDRIEQGWCWRIPLKNRVSLGLVVPESYALRYGESKEEQYDGLLAGDPILRKLMPNSIRITPILRFDNYQSVYTQMTGSNWAMLGDSAGFVDPVFSSGVLIAMQGAYKLADTISNNASLLDYEMHVKSQIEVWNEIVGYFYDGRLMTSIKVGQTLEKHIFNRLLIRWISRHVSKIFSGAVTSNDFSLSLLRFLVQRGLRGRDPSEYRIN